MIENIKDYNLKYNLHQFGNGLKGTFGDWTCLSTDWESLEVTSTVPLTQENH